MCSIFLKSSHRLTLVDLRLRRPVIIQDVTHERWAKIEALYLALADLNGPERKAILDRAEPEVRAEVEAMLAQPDRSKLLDHPIWTRNSSDALTPTLAPGIYIGQYRIEAEIGAGGMGVVYRAQDTKLHRPVAVKILADEMVDPAARRRFQREAQDGVLSESSAHPHGL
jgi:eukaryotic-like serine/threonine-protein kinase